MRFPNSRGNIRLAGEGGRGSVPLGVYHEPISVITPTAKGDSSVPIMKRRAKTCFVVRTAAKQNVTIVHRNSTTGR